MAVSSSAIPACSAPRIRLQLPGKSLVTCCRVAIVMAREQAHELEDVADFLIPVRRVDRRRSGVATRYMVALYRWRDEAFPVLFNEESSLLLRSENIDCVSATHTMTKHNVQDQPGLLSLLKPSGIRWQCGAISCSWVISIQPPPPQWVGKRRKCLHWPAVCRTLHQKYSNHQESKSRAVERKRALTTGGVPRTAR